ncbi:MAG: glycosyltransferase family 2 protein [Nanoarchaeota archaeon]|nr:glycosyltransferase family 2 protein [Nanoarchaeota archaeon]
MFMNLGIWTMYFLAIYFAVFTLIIVMNKGIQQEKKPLKKTPGVTIAIPAYNEERCITKTLQHVINLNYPKHLLEIIVIANACTDKTTTLVKQFIKQHKDYTIKLIEKKEPGKAAALNTALAQAQHDIFICLDADSYVEQDTLSLMLPHLQGEVAAVLPFMKITSRKNWILKIQWIEYLLNFFLKRIAGSIDCIQVTPGPFAMYQKKIIQKIGGFDTKTLTEDQEIAMRLQKHHYQIIQLLDATVYTEPPTTFKGWHKQRNRWYKGTIFNLIKHKNMIGNKNYGEFGMWQMPMIIVSALLSLAFGFFVVWQSIIYPLLQKLHDLSYINFNIGLMMQKGIERFSWLDMNFVILFFTSIVFLFALAWIISSHRYSKESYRQKGLWSTPLYLLIYPYLLCLVWFVILIDLIRGKIQRW